MKDILLLLCLNVLLAFSCILTIAVVQFYFSKANFTLATLWSNYFPFFTFQKGPIFLLAYFAVSTILFYFFKEELLKIKVQNYADLKKINQELSQQIKGKEDKILQVKIGNKYRLIDLQDIVWMEADEYCTCIHTKEKRPLKTRKSLKYFAAELAGTPFLRVHRKSIVNMQMVKTFVTTPSPKLILMDGTEIPISQRKLKSVKEYYKNLKL